MSNKKIKFLVLMTIVFTMVSLFSIECFAWNPEEHFDPTQTTRHIYEYPASQCNRVINVKMIDDSGAFLGMAIFHTKYGVDEIIHVGMGGYDIIRFESDQGIWETCKINWTSGGAGGETSDAFIDYYFRTRMSKKEINVTITMRKWDSIQFEVRHYVSTKKTKFFHRDLYKLHSVTDHKVLEYYDWFSVRAKNIYGYTLNSNYESVISENLCLLELQGKYENTPSSPRFFDYDMHQTRWAEGMKSYSTYDERKQGKIDWCDNRKVWIEFFYDIKEYSIKFDANGGYGVPNSLTKLHNVDITLPTEKPTRPGYTFMGWGTYRNDNTPNYQPGGKYTSNSARTLYAVWSKNELNYYDVTYNMNGGYGGPTDQKKYMDQPLELSIEEPMREGYIFEGWGTFASDTTPDYYPGDNYFGNEPLTLYAIWTSNVQKYFIQFNPNGGINPPEPIIKTEGIPIRLPDKVPIRNGYTFKGWSENKYASYPAFFAGGQYPGNQNIVLYAVWTRNALPTYTITFDANGGLKPPKNLIKTQGSAVYIPYETPTRNQYEFLGWSEGRFASSPTYEVGDAFTKNQDTTLYAVWLYNPATYRVWFEKEGGIGGPDVLSKQHGESIIIPTNIPVKKGYNFMGWKTRYDGYVRYRPGDIYSEDRTIRLYAVWERANYDFKLSPLYISNANPFRYEQIDVTARVFNMDNKNAYKQIPVDLYYDGIWLTTQYVDFEKYSYADITFPLNVGDAIGEKTIEVRVNWNDRIYELNGDNNSATATIVVKDYEYEVSVDPVIPSDKYTEATVVITSFLLRNDSDLDIIPDTNNTVEFSAFYFNNGRKVIIETQKWDKAVVPKHGTNLVYFQWLVPDHMAGKTICLECTANADHAFVEQNSENNTGRFTMDVIAKENCQTPNTRYESQKPNGYYNSAPPTEKEAQATWTMWEYRNGAFELKKYSIRLLTEGLTIRPSSNSSSAKFENGKWTMKSGYGITLEYYEKYTSVPGYSLADNKAFTFVQAVNAYFPEFVYSHAVGNYRTLEQINAKFHFVQNPNASGNAKEHFIPIFVDNGNYVISIETANMWTPVGMIRGVINSNAININGTMYDDFYVGGN